MFLWPPSVTHTLNDHLVWGITVSHMVPVENLFRVDKTNVIHVPQIILNRVAILRVMSEIGYGKPYILVCNSVRVFRVGQRTPTQNNIMSTPSPRRGNAEESSSEFWQIDSIS